MVLAAFGIWIAGGLLISQVNSPVHLRVLRRMETPSSCTRLALSPNGRMLAASAGDGVLWMDTHRDKYLRQGPASGQPLSGRSDQEMLLVGEGLQWWNLETGVARNAGLQVVNGDRTADILWAAPVPGQRALLVHGRVDHPLAGFQGDLYRWDLGGGPLQKVVTGFGFVHDFACSPQGTIAVAAVEWGHFCGNAPRQGALQWLDLQTGQNLRIAIEGPGLGVAFSADGGRLLWVDHGGLHEVTTEDLEFVREVRGSMRSLARVGQDHALTHDGLSVFLWDLRRLEPLCHWPYDGQKPSYQMTRPRRARVRHGEVYPPRPPTTGVWPQVDEPETILAMTVSQDGSTCVIAGEKELVVFQVRGI